MHVGFRDEIRGLVRAWYLWLLVPVAAVLAWRLLPLNAEFDDTFLDKIFVPRDGDDPRDEARTGFQTDVVAMYTSGFAAAQFLAMLAGTALALRDPRVTGRPGRSGTAEPDPDLNIRALLLAKAGAAALFGILLQVAAFAAALPGIAPMVHSARNELLAAGVPVEQPSLWDWEVLGVVVWNTPCFALWGVIGVGVGAIAGRWWRLAAAVGGYLAAALVFAGLATLIVGSEATVALAAALVVIPLIVGSILIVAELFPYPIAAVLLLVPALVAMLDGLRAVRGRLRRAAGRDGAGRNGAGGEDAASRLDSH